MHEGDHQDVAQPLLDPWVSLDWRQVHGKTQLISCLLTLPRLNPICAKAHFFAQQPDLLLASTFRVVVHFDHDTGFDFVDGLSASVVHLLMSSSVMPTRLGPSLLLAY